MNDLDKKARNDGEAADVIGDAIRSALTDLSPLPAGFREELSAKIGVKQKNTEVGVFKRSALLASKKIRYFALAAAFVAAVFFSGAFLQNYLPSVENGEVSSEEAESIASVERDGKSIANSFIAEDNVDSSYERADSSDSKRAAAPDTNSADEQSKIIENYWYGINTKDFDSAKKAIEDGTRTSGGFVESMNVYGTGTLKDPRTVSFVVRIPVGGIGSFTELLIGTGEVYRESKSAVDVTKHYREIEVEIANYEQAEKRYLALYEQAETIEDMLLIENELSRIRNYIDVRKAQIKSYDHQVAYSTFSIELIEVLEEKVVTAEAGTLEKAKYAFISSINTLIKFAQNMFIWFVSIIPIAILWLIAFAILYIIVKIALRRAARNKNSKKEIIINDTDSNAAEGASDKHGKA